MAAWAVRRPGRRWPAQRSITVPWHHALLTAQTPHPHCSKRPPPPPPPPRSRLGHVIPGSRQLGDWARRGRTIARGSTPAFSVLAGPPLCRGVGVRRGGNLEVWSALKYPPPPRRSSLSPASPPLSPVHDLLLQATLAAQASGLLLDPKCQLQLPPPLGSFPCAAGFSNPSVSSTWSGQVSGCV